MTKGAVEGHYGNSTDSRYLAMLLGTPCTHGINMQSVSGYLEKDIGSLTFAFKIVTNKLFHCHGSATIVINLKMQMRKWS